MNIARTLLAPVVLMTAAALLSPAATLASSAPMPAQYGDAAVAAWPEADLKRPYTVTATNAAFTADADGARIRLDRAGASAYAPLDDASAASTDLTFRITADKRPTGAGQSAYVVLRDVGSTSAYRLKIRLAADGRVLLRAVAIVGGTRSRALSNEVAVSGVKFTAGRWLKVRAQVLGADPTLVRAKVWHAGASQPTTWRYAAYDNTAPLQAKGSIGLGARLPLSSSSAPVTFQFDDLVAQSVDPNVDPPPTVAPPVNSRPYSDGSAWNTPISAGATYDGRSSDMVGTIGLSANGGLLSSDPTQYTYPVYVATADTPRHTISTRHSSRRFNIDGSFTSLGYSVPEVPMDASWASSAGTDSQMIIIDAVTGDEYDIFGYAGLSTFSASRISHYVAGTKRNGEPLDYISRGAGVPYLAGLIRPWEIAQGHIDHAIAFGYPFAAQGRCVGPATKTDGNSTLAMAIPEGARLQLDPTLDAADFDRWGLGATGRIIARAMQRYGVILIDVSGRPKLYAENTMVNTQSPTTWADVGGLNENTVAPIPFTALRVLDLPDGYWSGASDAPMQGLCYR